MTISDKTPATDASPRRVPTHLKQAAVLSGGGARGAYEVGVLKALIEGASPASGYQPVTFDVFSGTSVGAYNAAFMGCYSRANEDQAVAGLESTWRQRIANTPTSCGNGVFRIRGAPFQFLDAGCFLHPVSNTVNLFRDAGALGLSFAAQGAKFLLSEESLQTRLLQSIDVSAFASEAPLESLIADTIDLGRLQASDRKLAVVASDWQRGKPVIFSSDDLIYRFGTAPILASAALPGLFAPVVIENVPYVDGGTTMNTPLKPAIEAGADVLHIIFVDPRIDDVPIPILPNTLDTFYRIYLILVADNFRVDIGTTAVVNDAIRVLGAGITSELLRSPGNPLGDASPFGRALKRLQQGEPYRPLIIHKYRPLTTRGGAEDLLDFSIGNINRLIAEGYSDASTHDCAREGCVTTALPAMSRRETRL
jgi:NTE family protein